MSNLFQKLYVNVRLLSLALFWGLGSSFVLAQLPVPSSNPTMKQSAVASAEQSALLSHDSLDDLTANDWARLVLKGVGTEFPNKLSLVYSSEDQIKTPREHFPAFFGSFDWHSSVHGHWVLVRLLKEYPSIESAQQIRDVLDRHLSAENLRREADFFSQDEQKSFERMYGWAWFLRLTMELDNWQDADATRWRENLRPLEDVLVSRTEAYLPLLTYPIRIGQHTDTSFALGQILDYARAKKQVKLERLVVERSRAFYGSDTDYPVHYEPSGHDFFSSCWNEADLMRRVLPADQFEDWLSSFVPHAAAQLTDGTIAPVDVSDVSDPKIVHLAGLNLSRAWCLQSVASALREDHPLRQPLIAAAKLHLNAGMKYINSGHYEGDHWLATFGLYAIERIGIEDATD
ncbi:Protein of unknown function [Neorhodopirellula lusitana]|uniref:DUF2891 domain-containing protein n=2 Tax=Neorhodopirellula lusitana TaxID=445327 RepID=A0ABY1QDC2_9BACT|nr:DUF2891 domain-containing protein [Neorhodopirellula lusitana]SMP67343.1 Protein of unknown function [Neorhodopirellula lusitana]